MTLDKGWRFILSFALIGFLVAMLAGCCMDFNAPNVITNLMLSISPGLWFFLQRVLGSVGFANYHIAVWFSITVAAIANGMMYAIIGAVFVGLRWMWKHRETAKKS